MRLKKNYIWLGATEYVFELPRKGRYDEVDYHHVVKNNDTAHDVFRLLQEETTEEEIVAAMAEKYDAPRDVIAKDVHDLLAKFDEMGLLQKSDEVPRKKRFWEFWK